MLFKQRGARLVLGVLLIAGALACRAADTFIAQATTTPTRTPRPTFTPYPTVTDTPEPTLAPPPTAVPPTATRRPTARPTARPSPRPPTAPPPPPVQVQPTQPPPPPVQYTYQANPASCVHSGDTYIKGAVYDNRDDPNSKTPGIRVALGPADGNTVWADVKTDDMGEYTFIIQTGSAKKGTYYVWVLDASGKRISQIGGPINVNGLGPDAPGACWAGSVDFFK